MSEDREYNESITEEVLDQQEMRDPKAMRRMESQQIHVKRNDFVWAVNLDENRILHGVHAMDRVLTICRRHLLAGNSPKIDTDFFNNSKIYILGQK